MTLTYVLNARRRNGLGTFSIKPPPSAQTQEAPREAGLPDGDSI